MLSTYFLQMKGKVIDFDDKVSQGVLGYSFEEEFHLLPCGGGLAMKYLQGKHAP